MFSNVGKNILLLYFVRIIQLFFPFVTLPIVVRFLSKNEFGDAVTIISLGSLVGSIIEYGFNYTGTRSLAENADNPDESSKIFSSIGSAKIILSFIALFIILIYSYLNHLYVTPVFAFILAIGQGFNPTWAFQAIGKINLVVMLEFLSRLLILLLIFISKSSLNIFLYLMIYCSIPLLVTLTLNVVFFKRHLMYIKYISPWIQLYSSLNLFLFRAGALIFGGGSIVILSISASPAQIAIYAGAERFFRAVASLTGPVGEIISPRVSQLRVKYPSQALKMQLLGSSALITISLILSTLLFFSSHLIINSFLGVDYIDSVILLKILSLNVFLIGIGTAIGVIFIIPYKLDTFFTLATVAAGIWTLFSIIELVPKFGIIWMPWTLVIAEVIVISICLIGLCMGRKNAS